MLEATVAQAAGSAVVPITDAGKGIFRTLKRQYDYVMNLDKNVGKLEKAEEDLCATEADIKEMIEIQDAQETHRTATWLQRVTSEKQEIANLKRRNVETQKWLCGMCPSRALLKLSKDIVKKTKDIVDLKEAMNDANRIMTRRVPESIERRNPKKTDTTDLSLRQHVEKLLNYLNDKNMKRIGIWGPAGVGKTTIMENLNEKLEETHMFDLVIWVTVGKEWSVSKIQQVILERLKLNKDGVNSEQRIAYLISEKLKNRKYLLLLDQVFEEIDLHAVGIRENHDHGKLVLAFRERCLIDSMYLDDEVRVDRLSKGDAQQLFADLVGEDVVNHRDIKPIAQRIVILCGGLPKVIQTVASTLRKEFRVDMWQVKLRKLQSPTMREQKDMDDVLKAFELVYDALDEHHQKCLKYGALFPEDYEIYQDYLMECWKAQNFLPGVPSFRTARQEGHAILKTLIGTCLLERGRSMDHVRMPIIFRNMARGKYQENELLVGGSESTECTNFVTSDEKWIRAKMVSLVGTDLCELPRRPECENISTLLLHENGNLRTIPCSFFDTMSTLYVLNLYRTGIELLPPSISSLINLTALYLNGCSNLRNLPVEISKLKDLQVLDTRRTGIHTFPIEIRELSNLRCVRVSYTSYVGNWNHVVARPMKIVHSTSNGNQNHVAAVAAHPIEMVLSNLVGSLSLLEELTVDVGLYEPGWGKVLDNIGEEILDGCSRELSTLSRLTSLSFYFPNLQCFETFTDNIEENQMNDFRSFKIHVGHHATPLPSGRLDISGCSAKRHLRYLAGRGAPPAILKVLEKAYSFELIRHHDVQSLSEFGLDKMQCLEVCIIDECTEMEKILGSNSTGADVLPYLKKLHIFRLNRLNRIWDASAVCGSLAKLTTLSLNDCSNIKNVLSWEMTQQLPCLQHLRIENCSQLATVIEANNQTPVNRSSEALPEIKNLELVKLTKLD